MGTLYQEFLLALHEVRIRRLRALGVASLICALGWIVVWQIANRYQAEARVYAQVQNLLPEKIGVSVDSRQQQISRLKRTLTSAIVIDRMMRDPEIAALLPKDQPAIETIIDFRRAIEVIEQQENLFKISARVGFRHLSDAQNAQLARMVVQKLIDIFVQDNVLGGRNETEVSLRFLDQQIVDLQTKMRAANAQRAQYEVSMFGRVSGTGTVEQKIADARRELADVESDLTAAQMALLSANRQLGEGPVPASGQAEALGASGRLALLTAQLNDARARGLTDNHPDIALLRRQIARARLELGPGVRMLSSRNARSIAVDQQALVANLSARRAELRRQIGAITQTLAANPEIAAEQQRMVDDYTVLQEQYVTLVQKRESLRLQDRLFSTTDTVSFRIIDPPALPKQPALPDRSLLIAAVALLGIGAGPVAAFAEAKLQQRFATPEILRAVTGMQVIAAVPNVGTPTALGVERRSARLFWLGCAVMAATFIGQIGLDLLHRGVFG